MGFVKITIKQSFNCIVIICKENAPVNALEPHPAVWAKRTSTWAKYGFYLHKSVPR